MAGKKTRDELDQLELERNFLRNRNKELAKTLADKSIQYTELRKRIEELENGLINREMQLLMFKEQIRQIMDCVASMSVYLAKIGEEITYVLGQSGPAAMVVHSPTPDGQASRTHAVRPMVGGYTISRPTVNLPRVSTEQLVQLNANAMRVTPNDVSEHVQNQAELYSGADTDEEDTDAEDNSFGSEAEQIASDRASGHGRLETLHEVDEPSDSRGSGDEQTLPDTPGRSPLISGVFKDVRVYISPMGGPVRQPSNPRKRKSTSSQTCGQSSGTIVAADCPVASAYQANDRKMPEGTGAGGSNSYHRLEALSTSLSNTNNGELSLSMFQLAPSELANKISTPFAPIDVERRGRTGGGAADKENLCADPQQHRLVTRRGNSRLSRCRPSVDDSSIRLTSCRVVLNRLSPAELTERRAATPEGRSGSESDGSCSFGASKGRRSLRTKRSKKSLKEPSLQRKMRR